MDKKIAIAFTEVDEILNLMDEEYQNKIPVKLRTLITNNKLTDYNVEIKADIPLIEQNISRKAISILAVLNYYYWCAEEEKDSTFEKYKKNEIERQKKLRELYNPDNIFNTNKKIIKENNETKQLIVPNKKETFIIKIINKIKSLFN